MLESPAAPVLPSRSPYETRHLAALDGIRGLAILLVIWYHYWLITWLPADVHLFGRTYNFNAIPETGMTGVSVFFFVSGFCLFYPYAQTLFDGRPKQRVGIFAYRRMLKILPSYYFGLLLWVVLGFAQFNSPGDELRQILTHVFFVHTFFDDTYGGLNGVLWSLGVEVQFYLIFPALAWAAMRRPLPTFAALIVAGNLYRLIAVHAYDVFNLIAQLPGSIDTFAFGMLAAYAFRAIAVRRPAIAARRIVWTAVGAAGFVGLYLALENIFLRRGDTDWLRDWNVYGVPTVGLALVPATLGTLFAFSWWQRCVANPVLLGLSYVSYNLYLWHQLLAQALTHAGITDFRAADPQPSGPLRLLYTFAFAALGFAVAWTITTFVEQPLLRARPFESLFDRTKRPPEREAGTTLRELASR